LAISLLKLLTTEQLDEDDLEKEKVTYHRIPDPQESPSSGKAYDSNGTSPREVGNVRILHIMTEQR